MNGIADNKRKSSTDKLFSKLSGLFQLVIQHDSASFGNCKFCGKPKYPKYQYESPSDIKRKVTCREENCLQKVHAIAGERMRKILRKKKGPSIRKNSKAGKNPLNIKRLALGLTVEDLVKFSGISIHGLGHLLSDSNINPLRVDGKPKWWLYKLTAALRCDPEELFPEFYARIQNTKFILRKEFILADELIFNAEREEIINKLLKTLTSQEELVLKRRFGLEESLEEVGKFLGGISKQRVLQIEAKALRKLRHPSRKRKLCEFYSWNGDPPKEKKMIEVSSIR